MPVNGLAGGPSEPGVAQPVPAAQTAPGAWTARAATASQIAAPGATHDRRREKRRDAAFGFGREPPFASTTF
jgi:hypothetical protein